MSASTLIRLGGLAAGVLLVIAELMYLIVGFHPSAESFTIASGFIQNVLFLLSGVVLAGAGKLYAGQSGGALGSAAFLVAFVGTVPVAGAYWDTTFTVPVLAREVPELVEAGSPGLVMFGSNLSFGLFSLGWLLLGGQCCGPVRIRAGPPYCSWSGRFWRSSRFPSPSSLSAWRWPG